MILSGLFMAALAAPLSPDLQAERDSFNEQRRRDTVGALSVLVGGSVVSAGVGTVGWTLADDPRWVGFHRTTTLWAGINLAIGVPGLIGALSEKTTGLDASQTLRKANSLRVSYAFNTGLDAGWILLGAWVAERARREGEQSGIGSGQAMMVQGGFLLLYDAVFWVLRGQRDRALVVSPAIIGGPGLAVGATF